MISQTAEYALRATVHLAGKQGSFRKIAQIAESTGVPPGYLAKIMLSLSRARIVESKRGMDGGFALMDEPDEPSILAVVTAVDPVRRFAECPLGIGGHGSHFCPLHRRLNQTSLLVEEALGNTKVLALTSHLRNDHGQAKCQFPAQSAAGR